jgi:hypothetical protein
MLERVTEQYVSAATPTSSADRVHVLHRDSKPDQRDSYTSVRLATRRFHPAN